MQGDSSVGIGLRGFGLSVDVDGLAPPGAWEKQPMREPALRLRIATPEAIAQSWSGHRAVGWQAAIDGAPFVVERGVAGDHRFVHGTCPDDSGAYAQGTLAVHHLDADASLLQCAPADPDEPSWWRVVLDSVLFTVALLRGYEALHAGAVATSDGAIAIAAATGGGKSTLLTELLRHGLGLMADDVLVLEPRGPVGEPGVPAGPIALPAPPLMTVPAARLQALGEIDASHAHAAMEPICSLGQERWIAAPVSSRPLPLRALVVLDRRPGLGTSMRPIDDPLGPLLASLMPFPRSPERERARFELASALASTAIIWRLCADVETPPDVLAQTLLHALRDGRPRAAPIRERRVRAVER
jgi:hypothetical protein